MSRGPHHHGSEPVLACLAWLRCLAPAGIQELRVHVGESVSSEGRPVFIRILVVHTALALLASAFVKLHHRRRCEMSPRSRTFGEAQFG